MMGATHYTCGICAGAWCAWGVRAALVSDVGTPALLAGAVAGCLAITWLSGRAAFWPDLDHAGSTASKKGGRATALLSAVVSRMSCDVYDATATPDDKLAGNFRDHRGLTHFGITALILGTVAGILVGIVTRVEPRAMWAVAVAAVTGWAASEAYRWARLLKLRRDARSFARALARIYPLVGLLGGFAAWHAIPVPDGVDVETLSVSLGVGVGVAIVAGMLAHDLGDAATKTGVPLFWPLKIRGHRYYAVHIRPKAKLTKTSKDSPTERRVRRWSWVLAVPAVIGWIPGLYLTGLAAALDTLARLL